MELFIGLAGMALILGAFALEEFANHSRQESIEYNILNLVGSGLMSWYAWLIWSVPFLVLNLIWFVIAVVKIAQIARK